MTDDELMLKYAAAKRASLWLGGASLFLSVLSAIVAIKAQGTLTGLVVPLILLVMALVVAAVLCVLIYVIFVGKEKRRAR